MHTGGAYRVTINGAEHLSFHDSTFLTSQYDTYTGGDPVILAVAMRAYLLSFFRKTLADDDSTGLDSPPAELSSFTVVEKFGAH